MKNSQLANRTALITGVSGQDGAYLAQLLLQKGYRVIGTTRSASSENLWRLSCLGIKNLVEVLEVSRVTVESLVKLLHDKQCIEIYALAAQSSVGASFSRPYETMQSIVCETATLLEAVRLVPTVKLFIPSSSEVFGANCGVPITENSPFDPRSPYASARCAVLYMVREYRERYGLAIGVGFLFNHESSLRGDHFVTRKIVSVAHSIAEGRASELVLGNIDIVRDWGWAPEYVDAIWRMLQEQQPQEYIVATGKSYSLADFLQNAFSYFDLDWKKFVRMAPEFVRPDEPQVIKADPSKIFDELGWKATAYTPEVAYRMAQTIVSAM